MGFATVPLWGINLRSKVAVFWKALLLLYMTALPVRYLSHTPVRESHLKNESKWYLCSSSLSIHNHLVDHAAHGDLAPKWAENLKFSSPPKGANVGQRPPPRVDGAASGDLLPLYIVCARIKHAWRVACDPLRVFPNTYAIWKGIFLHILDYFTPYMAHITTLVPTDSKIRTFWSSYNFEVWANSLGNPLNLSYRRVQVSILERIPNPYTLSAVNITHKTW